MSQQYKHKQIGYLTLVTIGLALIMVAVIYLLKTNMSLVSWIVLIILTIALWLFSSLTVELESDFLKLYFGPGVIKKKFLLKNIDQCVAVRNKWYYGFGIRYTPHGWLFNVSGLDAVELRMKNGKKYRIGSDDAQNLSDAVNQAIRSYTEQDKK